MMRTFNNGIGLILVVPEDAVQEVLARLNAMDEKAFAIGEIVERKETEEKIKWI
jgi:phosphoribosylformylglycinamidine cyclo-ligase